MNRTLSVFALHLLLLTSSGLAFAQQPDGPQTSAPPPVAPAPRPAVERRSGTSDKVTVPAGTRVAVVLENGISTRSAKAGDSLYFRTSFPITQNNRVVVPVGSYLRGELLESKRPGRIKGRGEFRMKTEHADFSERVHGGLECRAAERGHRRQRNDGFGRQSNRRGR